MAGIALELGKNLIATVPPEHLPGLGECWEWSGTRNRAGYGIAPKKVNGTRLAHRISLMNHLGRDLNGHAMHLCDNPPCARPSHLREGTHAENMRDKAAKGRATAPRAGQKACNRGHALTRETTTLYERPDGYIERRCNECRRINSKLQAERRKQARHERGLYRRRTS